MDENAVIVNALQRHALVVVQKSVVEGFGLTVTEPMWKERTVLASSVGGIQVQITHDEDGLVVDDPHDLDEFADLLAASARRPPTGASSTTRSARRRAGTTTYSRVTCVASRSTTWISTTR